jgi:hypothetical protein
MLYLLPKFSIAYVLMQSQVLPASGAGHLPRNQKNTHTACSLIHTIITVKSYCKVHPL